LQLLPLLCVDQMRQELASLFGVRAGPLKPGDNRPLLPDPLFTFGQAQFRFSDQR
jgi:hypothetical protein